MKQILTTLSIVALMVNFASCEKTCKCNCNCCNQDGSDQTIQRPGGNDQNDDNQGNNGGNNGGNEETPGNTETYNHTFTQGYAGYYGNFYEEAGQPANVTNWFIELADDDYDLENYEGTGYNIALELFAAGTSSTSIPSGTYTVEAFDNSMFSAGSLMYGYIAEDETYGEYPAGTWVYSGDEAVAGATSGWVKISASGSKYAITYELEDEEYNITFKGSYTGNLEFYDATQEYSNVSASKVSKAPRVAKPIKRFRVRR